MAGPFWTVKTNAKTLVETELAFARSDVDTLLDASAATDSGSNTLYRPYAVAAYLWATTPNTRRLLEAKGARFANPAQAAFNMLDMQVPFDVDTIDPTQALTIPLGWSVPELRESLGSGAVTAVY